MMRWTPIEVDLLRGLEDLSRAPGRRVLIAPEGHATTDSLVGLLLREGRGFHETERDVEIHRINEMSRLAGTLESGIEHDPRTGEAQPASLPGHQGALDRLQSANERRVAHEAALARLALPEAQEHARELLRRYEIRPREELAALKASREPGEVVEIYPDGWSLLPTLTERLQARRELQGLPAARDWLD